MSPRDDASPRHRRVLALAALVLVGAAVAATFTQAPGEVVADARFEHVAAPGQFLQRHASVWDDERTLGEPTQYFAPVLGAFLSALGELGAPPWILQRSAHAVLLAASGIGTMLLARSLLAEPAAWVTAGVVYAFNPYTTQFLVPSGLFAAYAIAPWLALAAVEGLRPGADRWRWAAVCALAGFAVGMINTSSLLLAGLPALGLVLIRLGATAAGWRDVWAWVWRTALLTSGAAAAMLVTLALGVAPVRVNLETTETPETVAATTSASESWRGLGMWLSYFRLGGRQLRDQAAPYFSSGIVIAATFALLIVAGAALLTRRSRLVAGLAVLAAATVVVMVGIHPLGEPSPLGRVLDRGFDESLFVRGFRSTYKAGAGLQVALALLTGVAVAGASSLPMGARRWHRWVGRALLGTGLVAVLAVASFPFWTGELYPSDDRHDDIPAYWTETFEWFDDQPHEPGVLVLPSVARTRYRWGFVNDTLFDAHLAQPAVAARTLPQSTRWLADLTEVVDARADRGAREGTLAPILRRMGVRWVLLQNDLDWVAAGVPRPATYDPIRGDPGFRLAASFGDPGGRPLALDRLALDEGRLPQVEVYELVDPPAPGATRATAPIIVAGGGEAWPALARAGWLDHPVVPAAAIGDGIAEVADAAAAYVITDGAQRRAARVASAQSIRSPILAVGEDAGRPVQAVDDDIADQSIVTYPDLHTVTASSYGRALVPWDAPWRPANAVDGNELTAWASEARSPTLRIELARPTALDALVLEPYGETGEGPLSSATVELVGPDGESRVEVVAPGVGRIALPDAGSVQEVAITLERAEGVTGMVGLTEVILVGPAGPLDGREMIRAPGPGDPEEADRLATAVAGTEVHHVFTREPEQAVVNRAFWSPGGAVEMRATVRTDDLTPDQVIDVLVGSEVSAVAEARFLGQLDATGRHVLDGNVATAWQVDAIERGALTLRVPGYEADQVELWLVVEGALPFPLSRITEVAVEVVDRDGGVTVDRLTLGEEPDCDPAFTALGAGICVERVTIDLDPVTVASVRVEPIEIDAGSSAFGTAPAQLADVRLRLRGVNLLTEDAVGGDDGCRSRFILDGEVVTMRPVGQVTLESLAGGLDLVSCVPVELDTGWHRLEGLVETSFAIETVHLSPVGSDIAPAVEEPLAYERRDPTRRRLAPVEVAAGDVIVTDVAAHPGWKVSAEGPPGRRLVADGFVAWQASAGGTVQLDLRFEPQRWYRAAWVLTAVSVAASLWLVVPARREDR